MEPAPNTPRSCACRAGYSARRLAADAAQCPDAGRDVAAASGGRRSTAQAGLHHLAASALDGLAV